jgi:hypothetical protein
MTERPTVEAKSRLTTSTPDKPNLSLTWCLDPTTGKPVARWTIERPSLALRSAA